MNVILTEANRMTRLVSDLLQLTKFDYKKVAWNKIEFPITELTKQICEKHKKVRLLYDSRIRICKNEH